MSFKKKILVKYSDLNNLSASPDSLHPPTIDVPAHSPAETASDYSTTGPYNSRTSPSIPQSSSSSSSSSTSYPPFPSSYSADHSIASSSRNVYYSHSEIYPASLSPDDRPSTTTPEANENTSRQTRRRRKDNLIPEGCVFTEMELIHSKMDVFNKLMEDNNCTPQEICAYKDIRRRGKNRVIIDN